MKWQAEIDDFKGGIMTIVEIETAIKKAGFRVDDIDGGTEVGSLVLEWMRRRKRLAAYYTRVGVIIGAFVSLIVSQIVMVAYPVVVARAIGLLSLMTLILSSAYTALRAAMDIKTERDIVAICARWLEDRAKKLGNYDR